VRRDVDRAVEAAKAALPEWLETTPAERAGILLALADLLDEHAEELAAIESRNVGKPLSYARDEIPVCSDNIRFFAGAARVLEGRSAGEYMRGYTLVRPREPLGIVGGIAPWNYPLMMAVWKFAPALAAGNTQVLKPSEQTPLSLLRFVELAQKVIPPGVLNVVTGRRRASRRGDRQASGRAARVVDRATSRRKDDRANRRGQPQARAPRARRQGAGRRLRRRDPAAVAEGIKIAGYWNSGQDCTAASRIVAGPKIYDSLLEALVPAVESLHVGDPSEGDSVEMGPVISKEQQERVLRLPRACEGRDSAHGRRGERLTRLLREADGRRGREARRTRSFSARSSARSSRCSASPTTTRRSRGRTT
jgi:betaine-aldehyde dehydrogenase/aminobutyraldehyde dehydrogenase